MCRQEIDIFLDAIEGFEVLLDLVLWLYKKFCDYIKRFLKDLGGVGWDLQSKTCSPCNRHYLFEPSSQLVSTFCLIVFFFEQGMKTNCNGIKTSSKKQSGWAVCSLVEWPGNTAKFKREPETALSRREHYSPASDLPKILQ